MAMTRGLVVLVALVGALVSASSGYLQAAGQQPSDSPALSGSPQRALLDRYCVTCHNEKLRTAGLTLDTMDVTNVSAGADVWEKVIQKLRMGAMPPPGRPRPDQAAYDAFATYLETSLDRAAAAHPNPGRTETLHRLNRTEYQNAIRDLLALEIDVASMLPADEADRHGFDNMAGVLSVSPALLDRYVSAANKISRLAVGVPPSGPVIETYHIPLNLLQDDRLSEELPFASRGGLAVRHHFPVEGEYLIKVRLQTNYVDYIRGIDEAHQIEIRLDGMRVKQFTVGGESPGKPAPASYEGNIFGDPTWENYMHTADAGLEVRVPVRAGPHVVGVSFPRETWESEGVLQPRQSGFALAINAVPDGNPRVGQVTISGPYQVVGPGDTASRRNIFVCQPTIGRERSGAGRRGPREPTPTRLPRWGPRRSEPRGVQGAPRISDDEAGCAKKILSALARRAYRRPVTKEEVETLVSFYKLGRAEGTLRPSTGSGRPELVEGRQAGPERRSSFDQAQDDRSRRAHGVVSLSNHSFDAGIQAALERLLVDPNFLFRIERDAPKVAPATAYRLSDLELASRLSFFVWSSIPDDELLEAATRGKLSDPKVLERQVRRMLADPRSKALIDNFVGQWLYLRNIRSVYPDPDVFPEFDDNLREALQRETELFFESQLREDRSVVELLSANYTFLNERLARHYGIPNIYGNRFRRVTFSPLSDVERGGLLGHGSLLTVTSYPNRTSPVLRGKWLLENILGTPPPPPPPDVPALPDRGEGGKLASVRERLEQHRRNPACTVCHAPMDPLGFALENFDAIGGWRASEAGASIDASGALPNGNHFEGLAGLRTVLLSQREQFVRTVTEKLLTYALGRGVEYYDLPEVRTITREATASDYRWSSIILGIVKSTPFQMRRSES